FSVPDIPIGQYGSIQDFDKAVGNLSSVIKTLVNDETFFIDLAVEHSHQIFLTVQPCAGNIDITNLAIGCFFDIFSVLLNPGQIAKSYLGLHRLHVDGLRFASIGVRTDFQSDGLVRQTCECRVWICEIGERYSIDAYYIVPFPDVEPWFIQGRSYFGVPGSRPDDLFYLVGSLVHSPVDAEVSDRSDFGGFHVPSTPVGMRCIQFPDQFSDQIIEIFP